MKRPVFRNVVIAAVIAMSVVFAFNFGAERARDRRLLRSISAELAAQAVSKKDMAGKRKFGFTEVRYRVAASFPFNKFEKRLEKALGKAGYKVSPPFRRSATPSEKGEKGWTEETSYFISAHSSDIPVFCLTLIRTLPAPKARAPVAPAKAKVAIVLDDWGYNIRNLASVTEIDKPLTIAILPNLRYSSVIANRAKEKKFEVIMHMSMEPKAKMRLESDTLYTAMDEDKIRSVLASALKSVPYARGISNHEGSKATEDEKLMQAVLAELKKRELYFLDSLVTNDSLGESISAQAKVKFAKRSVFLDNEDEPGYIRGQFGQLLNLAVAGGEAIGIGHDRHNTILVLKEMIPVFEEKGVELTYVSDLAR